MKFFEPGRTPCALVGDSERGKYHNFAERRRGAVEKNGSNCIVKKV